VSYILSALKKAEAERGEQSADAGVSAIVEAHINDKHSRAPRLVGGIAVIAIAALAAWLWLPRSGGPTVASTDEAVIGISMPAHSLIASNELAKPALSQKPTLVAPSSAFDNIDIKGHLYVATRPSLRKVVINDRTLREGQKINGILVEEITETGVLLSFGGLKKTISVY
jgi:hypothetical protein